jgi:hypothetical protein
MSIRKHLHGLRSITGSRAFLQVILLVVCTALVVDQYFFTHEERSTYLGQQVLREERAKGRGFYRWRRWDQEPAPRLGRQVHAELWHVAVMANDRWFQYQQRDNGVLQPGDTVRMEVAPLTGRVLRFQRLGHDTSAARTTVDAFEDIAPIPALMAILILWSLLPWAGPDARTYLHFTVLILGLVFLLALFALSWPTLKLLGWA